VDPSGQQATRLVRVDGNGVSSPFTYPNTGVVTLFIAALDYQRTGWYSGTVSCASWPAIPCDCTAFAANYSSGWPGTNGVPSLTATSLLRLGSTGVVHVGNSYGQSTSGVLLLGTSEAAIATQFGGTILVEAPTVLPIPNLPLNGSSLPFPIPNNRVLCGIAFALQALVVDPGASHGVAFSRGLIAVIG
jgi:hypothetical protein